MLSIFGAHVLAADGRFTIYFSNDSVNGIRLSDAYETHNMGALYRGDSYYAKLDLGIVSPDMYEYRNQYRNANRSFGELITLEVGSTPFGQRSLSLYGGVISSGEFGIDRMQDFMHDLLSLQPVNDINDIVRMPSKTWVGLGVRGSWEFKTSSWGDWISTADYYLGTNNMSAQIDFGRVDSYEGFELQYKLGFRGVAYDNIVSAPPINARVRHIIPLATIGLRFNAFGYDWFVNERLSLPTIASDDRIYAVLGAGVSFQF